MIKGVRFEMIIVFPIRYVKLPFGNYVPGVEGNYLTVSPESIGMSSMWNGVHVMPGTLSMEMKKQNG